MGGDGSISATAHFAYRNNEVIQMDKQDKEMETNEGMNENLLTAANT